MKLYELLTSLSIHAHLSETHPIEMRDGEIEITPSMIATLTARDLGSRAAECIARVAGRVRLTSYSFYAAPLGVGRMRDSSHSGAAIGMWSDSSWRIDGDATWRRYGPGTTAIFGGNTSVRAFVGDVDLSDDDAAKIRSAIVADNHERHERVVWRPRPNQFVMSVFHDNGRYNSTTVLMPDGTEKTFYSPEGRRILIDVAGSYEALAKDPVWGRSSANHIYGNNYGTWFRVIGWKAYRRLIRAERAFLVNELPCGWSRADLRLVIEAHYAPRPSTEPYRWLCDDARRVCPHATEEMIKAIAPLHFDGRDRRVLEILDAIRDGRHALS